jgi:TIR domain
MNASIIPPILADFLTAYMSVESDLPRAVRAFEQRETRESMRHLVLAVKETLGRDVAPAILDREIALLTNVALSARRTGRDVLLELFESLRHEDGMSQALRAYDVFVSYSAHDAALASWLASELRSRGYSVWLDRDEILVGHSILDEVYRGIRESEFLIVMLTANSLRSRWVREELNAARLRELEHDRVVVLPVKCEPGIEIPEVLRTKRWADISSSKEQGLAELTRAIDVHRSQAAVETPTREGPAHHTGLNAWAADVVSNLAQYGYDATKGGYRDVVVGPPDGEDAGVDRRQLLDLLDRTRVRIRGWGGPFFPYESRRAELTNVNDGVCLSDVDPWPYSEWNFYFWRVSTNGRFFQRSGLNEDGDLGADGTARLRGALYVVWELKDICAALVFASRLLGELPSLRRLIVVHRLLNMNGRRLASRRFSLWEVHDELICREDSIEQVTTMTRDTNLEAEALRVALDVFWLFNWRTPSEELIRRDIRSFISGTFPSPSL